MRKKLFFSWCAQLNLEKLRATTKQQSHNGNTSKNYAIYLSFLWNTRAEDVFENLTR